MALRFRDWKGLDAAKHARLSASAGDFARRLEPRLNAFAAFESGAITPAHGVLDGMPYAAKDRMRVQGFHYPFPSLAHVEKNGTGYREIPVIWNPTI
jgi:Asp-tRNA(Asn)/Glu-tRNA(Gln) amidotransferase A subunit family amidase